MDIDADFVHLPNWFKEEPAVMVSGGGERISEAEARDAIRNGDGDGGYGTDLHLLWADFVRANEK